MKEESKRISYLDVIKFISIIMVIFCHDPLLNKNSIIGNIMMLCCWAAVPMFFMATGAIFLNREFNYKKWLKRIIKVYITLVIWKIIYLLFSSYWCKMNILEISKTEIIQYIFFFKGLNAVRDGHMWFIYAYLFVMMLYPAVLHCFNEKQKEYRKYYIFIFIAMLIGTFVLTDMNNILKIIGNALNKKILDVSGLKNSITLGGYTNCLIFFILGGIFSKFRLTDKYSKKRIILFSIIECLIGIIGLVLLRYAETHTFTWDFKYLNNGYNYSATTILAVSLFVLIQTIDIKSNKIINVIAQNTLGIFYMHIIIMHFVLLLMKTNGVIFNCIKTLIILIISTALCFIMKKIKFIKEIV